jgi:hypothetical protein
LNTSKYLSKILFTSEEVGWIFGEDGIMYKTENSGSSWILQPSITDKDIHNAFFINADTGWIVGQSNTIFKTNDGGITWTQQFQTSSSIPVLYGIYFHNALEGWVSGSLGKVMKTVDGGDNWISVNVGSYYAFLDIQFSDSMYGMMPVTDGTIYQTFDGGDTWENLYTDTHNALYCVHPFSNGYGWAGGVWGTIMRRGVIHSEKIIEYTCDSLNVGTVYQKYTDQFGCDSIVVVETFLENIDTTFQTAYTCIADSVGVEINVLADSNGCDSIVITNYEFVEIDTTLSYLYTCDIDSTETYTETFFNIFGCDSILITNYQFAESEPTNLFQFTCEEDSAGTYVDLLSNIYGCDSLVTLNLSWVPIELTDTIIISESGSGNGAIELILSSIDNYSFDWNTGDTTSIIQNLSQGPYEVIITDSNGCEAIFNFYVPLGTSIIDEDIANKFGTFFPNPLIENTLIFESATEGSFEIEVFDILSKKILTRKFNSFKIGNQFEIPFNYPSGTYFISVTMKQKKYNYKLLKLR